MANDPLPSWKNGDVKSAIMDFVTRATEEEGPDFIPPAERIATFDNDGTLWCEYPLLTQIFFMMDRVRELAQKEPSLKTRQPFKALLEGDHKALHAIGKKGLFEALLATHAKMTEEEFEAVARDWFESAKHPKLDRPFTQCVYRPQLELLQYLRDNGFKTFIVSGGGVDFMRVVCEEIYGVAREQAVGSSVKLRFEANGHKSELKKRTELDSFDDNDVKPQNIGLHIGRRPVLAFGNSDGDLAMLRYANGGDGARLALLVHHDDDEREFAYDRDFELSPLSEALDKAGDYGVTVVSMKRDWAEVF